MEFNKLLCVSFTLVPIIDLNSFLFHFHCILLFPLPEFCFFGDLNTLDNSETLHTQFQWPWIGFQFLCFISFWLQQNCRTLSYVGENDFPLFMVKLLQHPTSRGGWFYTIDTKNLHVVCGQSLTLIICTFSSTIKPTLYLVLHAQDWGHVVRWPRRGKPNLFIPCGQSLTLIICTCSSII